MSQVQHMLVMSAFFLSVTGGVHYYLYLRMVRDSGLSSPFKEIALAVIVLLWISLPLMFILGRGLQFEISRVVTFVPYTWLGVMMLLFFAFLSVDVAKLIVVFWKKAVASGGGETDPSRRLALSKIAVGATVATVAGMAAVSVANGMRKAIVKKIPVALKRFPESMNGLKIVQISDLHIGITVGSHWLEDLVKRVNALKPDIVAITGDLVDGEADHLEQEILPLKKLKATHGVYFVTGNHEYYSGVGAWISRVKALGVRVLRNESIAIGEGEERFYLAGVDDYSAAKMFPGHGQNIEQAVKDIPTDKSVVLLAHQPKAVVDASDRGVELVLAGHTHGGQIWPFSCFVGLQQPYNKGLFQHSESTQIYVNQGTFLWGPPMRLGTESEITELVLTREG